MKIKKKLASIVLALVMLVSALPMTAFAAESITATIETSQTVGGYVEGNAFGTASMSNGTTNVHWMCMYPEGMPPAVGHKFSAREATGLYRVFAYMASQTSDEHRLWNIHHAVSELHGTNNGVFYAEQQAVYKEAQNFDTSKIPENFVAFIADPTTSGGDQICLMWGTNPTGSLTLVKTSSNTAITSGNSNYSLAGAVYGVYKNSDCSGKVGSLTTKADGTTNTLTDLNAGWYYAKETSAPDGFKLDTKVHSIEVKAGQTATLKVSDAPETGSLQIRKDSANPSITDDNACYSVAGAEYTVYKEKACSTKVGVCTIDKNGTSNKLSDLAFQIYYAKETKAPKGMALDTEVYAIKVNSTDTAVLDVTDLPGNDPVHILLQKVDATTGKAVATGDGSLAGAEYTVKFYAGAVTEADITGNATRAWVFKTDEDGEVDFSKSYLVSGDEFYYHAGAPTLPFGAVTIQETKAPKGYMLDENVYIRFIKDDGSHAESVNSYNAPTIEEQPIMGRIQIVKHTDHGRTRVETPEVGATFDVYLTSAGSYDAAPANARDQLTIDKDGFAMTKDLPWAEYTVHQTGGWEGSKFMEDFTVKIRDNDETYSFIINNERFYAYLKIVKTDSITGEQIPVDGVGFQIKDPAGELVSFWGVDTWYSDAEGIVKIPAELEYGKGYQAIEVSAPEGYILADKPFMFNVVEEESMKEDDLTIIQLTAPNTPTTVQVDKVDADGNPVVGAKLQVLNANGTVVDEWVSDGTGHIIYKLSIGSEYTLREVAAPEGKVLANDVVFTIEDTADTQYVTMIDKTVNVEKLDPYGTPVVGAALELLDSNGAIVDSWTSDGTAHAAVGLIAGEKYTLHETAAPDGWLLADDVTFTVADDGQNQTVTMEDEEIPEIHTTASVDGNNVAIAKDKIILTDTISYEKLVPGREYKPVGKLMDQETEKPVLVNGKEITATTTFVPTEASGTVDVVFEFDASGLAGHSVVVFEDLYRNGKLYCSHADITDSNQTVHFPEIGTTATVEGEHVALAAEKVTLTDTIRYKNLVPDGRVYTPVGKLMDQVTGEPVLDKNGKEITATTTFVPTKANGTVDVIFTFDATGLAGHSVVVFEDVYDGDILVATHADLSDELQTVHFPEIGTTATVNGSHTATTAKNVKLVDAVEHTNLIPGYKYDVVGLLMDATTGKPVLDANGKEITAKNSFTATKADGTVQVIFTFDASGLDGHDVVVFENVYHDGILVATHSNIKDAGQTVHFEKPDVPQTGDAGIMAYAAMGSISALAAALMLRKRREDEEA